MKRKLVAVAVGLACVAGQVAANSFNTRYSNSAGEADPVNVAREASAFASKHADWARPFMQSLYQDGEWGAVLNLNRLGLAAMEQQKFDLARKAFDQAITRVEAVYAGDTNAEKARSVFNAEKVKDFKGEPYERAMMYYYRGLLYLHEGDYQNARAAFLAADRHDTLSSAEDRAFAGDFGLMKYLAGWASACDGDAARAEQLIGEARSADAAVRALPERPANSIVLVDAGPAPVKWGDGQHKHILKFKAGRGDDAAPSLRTSLGAEISSFTVAGDVTYQATTRGGRAVDGIMAGKAQFKDTANAVGQTAMVAGTQLIQNAGITGNKQTANAGFAGLLIGLVAKGIESAATPEADVRAWDTLPARVLAHADADVARQSVTLVMPGRNVEMPLRAEHGACSFAWGRTRSALDVQASTGTPAQVESNRAERNRAFRSMLVQDLAASDR